MSLHPTKATSEYFKIPSHQLKKGWREGRYPAVEIQAGSRRELRWDWDKLAPILQAERVENEQSASNYVQESPAEVAYPPKKVRRGSVWYLEAPNEVNPGDPKPYRPVVVVSAQHIADCAQQVTVCMMTTQPHKAYDFHVTLSPDETGRESIVLCEKTFTVQKTRLKSCVCHLSAADMARVDRALANALGLTLSSEADVTLRSERDMYRNLYMQAMSAWSDKVRGLA